MKSLIIRNSRRAVCSLAALVLMTFAAMSARADNLTQVSTISAQNATDTLPWAKLGPDQTLLGQNFNATTAVGNTVGVALTGASSIISTVCPPPAPPGSTPFSNCSWTVGVEGMTPMNPGDTVLWASDSAAGGNGPITLNFSPSVQGAGALIQANAPGVFTAQIQFFNGATLLATFTAASDAGGDPVYLGAIDTTGANITQVVFSITNCSALDTSNCTDFGLDTVELNDSVPATHFSVTNTPASTTAGTAFMPVTVTALTQTGATATTYSGTVHFTSTDPQVAAGAGLPADSTLTNGAGNFGATLKTAGAQTITATDTVTSSITGRSSVIEVNPAGIGQFLVSAPLSVNPSTSFNLQVTAEDAFGNTIPSYTGTVQFAASGTASAGTIVPGNYTFTGAGAGKDNGTHQFPNGATAGPTTGSLTITVNDTVTTGATGSATLTVTSDAMLTPGPARTIKLFRNPPQILVGTFSDADPAETGKNLSVVINWGDGTGPDTGGTLVHVGGNPNTFQVFGSHAYAHKGRFTVTVTIHDSGGSNIQFPGGTVTFFPRNNSF